MDTAKLKKFAQYARRSLIDQVTSKLVLVQAEDSAARRENVAAIKKLEEQISEHGKDQVIEKIAYIWFNRFCALRFMDVNRYTRIGFVSPIEGQFQPEILAEAKMGHIDEDTVPEKKRQQIFALLGGTAPSQDPQAEAYRLLVVAACNDYHKAMPYLFERIADYTELLMPDDLLSGNSILAYTREAMTPDMCQDVEVIGWLYQFYISEKKDKVFDDLKKNKKITPENIPAATQLFTPHWIVRYLVENSLGRLWMLNRPNSRLFEKMDYYIHPEDVETDFLRINKAEELKIVDPACGSGHMLVYAFDLLYAIYEEEGVDPSEIPEKILTHNLYGIEIDERAGELAAFALTMKARAKQKRFFRKPVQPNICVLQAIHFDETEINEYMDFVGQDIFTLGLKATLSQFEEADNFGSLIRPEVTNVQGMLEILNAKDVSSHLFYSLTHEKVLQVLNQADYLSPKYHVVIANPPYMGGKGMNGRMGAWVKDNYPNSKSDLFAMFIERNLELAVKKGAVAMITMQSWMFLSSYEKLRNSILDKYTIISMAHLGARAFDSIGGEVVSTTAFVLENAHHPEYKGAYVRLVDGNSEAEKQASFKAALV
jgi:SAM-dependent methyltransferase